VLKLLIGLLVHQAVNNNSFRRLITLKFNLRIAAIGFYIVGTAKKSIRATSLANNFSSSVSSILSTLSLIVSL